MADDWEKKYVVCRLDRFRANDKQVSEMKPSGLMRVKEILNTAKEAQLETSRLNKSSDSGCEYYWDSAKYYPEGREVIEQYASSENNDNADLEYSEVEVQNNNDVGGGRRAKVSLRFESRKWKAEKFTNCMGVEPSRINYNGDWCVWLLESPRSCKGTLAVQIQALFDHTTDNIQVWEEISQVARRSELSIGIFSPEPNLELDLPPHICREVGERQLTVFLDMYQWGGTQRRDS